MGRTWEYDNGSGNHIIIEYRPGGTVDMLAGDHRYQIVEVTGIPFHKWLLMFGTMLEHFEHDVSRETED